MGVNRVPVGFTRRPAVRAVLAVFAVGIGGLLSSCSKDAPTLSAETASFDIAVGTNERLMVGVSDVEGNVLAGGSVKLRVSPLEGKGSPFDVRAEFLPIPGRPQPDQRSPKLVEPSKTVGVYLARQVTFPTPGPWEIRVDAGGAGRAVTAVMVNPRHQVPLPGSPAPLTRNPTVDTPGIRPGALDSSVRDATLADLTDRDLHRESIASLVEAKRPFVVVVSTPVYCMSRFCGPTTDQVEALAARHPKVGFVHLEVWEDYDRGRVSPYAAEWISPGGDPTADAGEPWVFAVDGTGTITARWDNVLDLGQLRTVVTRLEASQS